MWHFIKGAMGEKGGKGDFTKDMQKYGEEFELHYLGNWQLSEVSEPLHDKIRVKWLCCSH